MIVDFDGSVACCADLVREATFHCPNGIYPISVGIEIVQGKDAELYEGQLDVVVQVVDTITRAMGIQRQIPHRYLGPVKRFSEGGGQDAVGVVGHRDCDKNRGRGDPGPRIMNMLGLAGYEPVDYDRSEDRDIWRRRQRAVGIDPTDGIPGPITRAALERAGHPHGQWVKRPGDVSDVGPLVS